MTLREFTQSCLIASRDTGCRQPTASVIAGDWLEFDAPDLDEEGWAERTRELTPTVQHYINQLAAPISVLG